MRELLRVGRLTSILTAVAVLTFSALNAKALDNISNAQTRVATSPQPVPLHHLYWYFFRYQQYLDRKASLLQQRGKSEDAKMLQTHLQKDLRFTNAQISTVRTVGQALQKDLEAIQAEARPLIAQDRQWIKLNGHSAGPPPGHAQVHQLQEQREATVKDAVAKVKQQLGPAASARLETYVQTHLRAHKQHLRSHRPNDLPGTPYRLTPRQDMEVEQ